MCYTQKIHKLHYAHIMTRQTENTHKLHPIIHQKQQSFEIRFFFIELIKNDENSTTSRPKFTVLDSISTCFLLWAALLVIKSPLLVCTLYEIIVTTMEWKQTFRHSFFDPWVSKQVQQWIIYWFLKSWITVTLSEND